MRLKPSRIVLAVLLIIGAGIYLDWFLEPSYEGHRASWWLDQISELEQVREFRDTDLAAFRAMGPPGIRYLGRTAASRNFFHRKATEERQVLALNLLVYLGPDAAPALPSLVRMFQNDSAQSVNAALLMLRFAPTQLEFLTPELIADLTRTPPTKHLEADIDLLNIIGPKAKAAMPALSSIVREGNKFVSVPAVIALWNIGHETNVLLASLSNSLSSHEDRENWLLWRCGKCRTLPHAVIPLFERALRHPQPTVRHVAEILMDRNDPARLRQVENDLNLRQDELLRDNLALLQSTNALDRINAAKALQFFGPKAAEAVPRLVEILGFPPLRSEPVEWLIKERPAVFLALQSIGSNASLATPRLTGLLHDPFWASLACDVLANIGPPAAPALPALRALLATNYIEFTNTHRSPGSPLLLRREIVPRWKAAQALASIDPHETNAVAILWETAKEKNNDYREPWAAAAITLYKLGLSTNLPIDEIDPVNDWNLGELGDIGAAAKKAVPLLETRLKRLKRSSNARSIAWALTRIDPEEAAGLGLPGLYIICPDRY